MILRLRVTPFLFVSVIECWPPFLVDFTTSCFHDWHTLWFFFWNTLIRKNRRHQGFCLSVENIFWQNSLFQLLYKYNYFYCFSNVSLSVWRSTLPLSSYVFPIIGNHYTGSPRDQQAPQYLLHVRVDHKWDTEKNEETRATRSWTNLRIASSEFVIYCKTINCLKSRSVSVEQVCAKVIFVRILILKKCNW